MDVIMGGWNSFYLCDTVKAFSVKSIGMNDVEWALDKAIN